MPRQRGRPGAKLPAVAWQGADVPSARRAGCPPRFTRVRRVLVPPYYDSLLAKVICQGRDRAEAIARMRVALESFVVEGVTTTIPFLARVMHNDRFVRGDVDTKFLEREPELFRELRETV